MEKKNSIKKWLYFFSIALLAIVFANLATSMDIIGTIINAAMPIIIGIVIAYALYLPERKLEKILERINKKSLFHKKRRAIAIFIIYVLAGLVIYGIIKILNPIIYNSISDFISNLPKYYKTIEESKILDSDVGGYIVQQVEKVDFSKYLDISSLFNYLKNTISIAKGIFSLFVSVVGSVYLLSSRSKIMDFWNKQTRANMKKENYVRFWRYVRKSNGIFEAYLSSQIIDSLIVGVVAATVLSFLQVKYSVVLGLIIGISNLIPFFGAILGIGLSLIVIALTSGVNSALISGVIVILLQQVDANIINPKITSTQVDVSPIVTITSITIFGAVFGVLGMFLAVPIAAILKMIMIDNANEKLNITPK